MAESDVAAIGPDDAGADGRRQDRSGRRLQDRCHQRKGRLESGRGDEQRVQSGRVEDAQPPPEQLLQAGRQPERFTGSRATSAVHRAS
jgi:hypothetical protein